MGGTLAGVATRVASGVGLVGCAAVLVFAIGGAGTFGGLGTLFGAGGQGPSLEVASKPVPAADIVAPAARSPRTRTAPVRIRAPKNAPPVRRHLPPTPPPRRESAPSAPSAPSPSSPALPPAPTPIPQPGNGQIASTLAETVKQAAGQAPPQAQPIAPPVDNLADTLVQTCQGLPVCP